MNTHPDWMARYLEKMVELGHVGDDGELVRHIAVNHVLKDRKQKVIS